MIRFIKYRWLFVILSSVIILFGLISALSKGFVLSVDFLGGGLVEFSTTRATSVDNIHTYINTKYSGYLFQKTSKGFVVKSKDLKAANAKKLTEDLVKKYTLKQERFELVGPSVGAENIKAILVASALAILGILVYLTINFKNWSFAVAAIIALFHDMVVLLLSWSIFGFLFRAELDILFITSLLTTMSFSVHDTIIILDKIREEQKQQRTHTLEETIDLALNLTMVRSLNNSLTVVIMLSTLIILGGESVRWFAVALLVGTLVGTYSSPFIATPIYYLLERKRV
ncbi:MAG: protein translocase subunit SecF [Patescibacteria group bacterium]|jgi:preprotein translocase subunit SecF